MIVKPMPGSDLGMYVPAEEPKKNKSGGFKVGASEDLGTYRCVIQQKLKTLSRSKNKRKEKDKIKAKLRKEFEEALKLSGTKSLGTYNHDASKCHVLNPDMDPNASDEEYEQTRREIEEEKQKQQKEKATKSGCCGSSSCQDSSSSTKCTGKDEVRYRV